MIVSSVLQVSFSNFDFDQNLIVLTDFHSDIGIENVLEDAS